MYRFVYFNQWADFLHLNMQYLILFSGTMMMADQMLFSRNLQTLVLILGFQKSFRASILSGNIQKKIGIFPRRRSSAPACSSKQLNRDTHIL